MSENLPSAEQPTRGERREFNGNIVILGLGSISHGVIPLLFQQLSIQPSQVLVIAPRPDRSGVVAQFKVRSEQHRLTQDNYETILKKALAAGDILVNLSVEVESLALIKFCRRHDILYIDTCIEPWPGGYDNPDTPLALRTNYALRKRVLDYRQGLERDEKKSTAIVTLGANPGLASIFVKQALRRLAHDNGITNAPPLSPGEHVHGKWAHGDWAALARQLDVRVIHIAERDTQIASRRKQKDEFVNTWSVTGFVSEGMQPSELGWGTHEKHFPADGERHSDSEAPSIFLRRPGIATRVRSWTPLEGPYHGFLVTHGESISIADHLSVYENGRAVYRPTVHYAYYPCDDAVLSLHEISGHAGELQKNTRIMLDEIESGRDELGVLLLGNKLSPGNAKGKNSVYWFGSRLTIEEARALAPYNSATTLQVVAGVVAGILWMLDHPRAGLVEPDDLDDQFIFDRAKPYLGEVVGVYGDWTPLHNRSDLFEEPHDTSDPWQFINFRVH